MEEKINQLLQGQAVMQNQLKEISKQKNDHEKESEVRKKVLDFSSTTSNRNRNIYTRNIFRQMIEEKTEFEKMLEKLEKTPVPERTCDIHDETCESCSG